MSPHLFPELAANGLLLQSSISVGDLPNTAAIALADSGFDLGEFETVLMFGQAGRTLWSTSVRHHLDRPNPFDDTAVELVEQHFGARYPNVSLTIAYPGAASLPLIRMAELVGWGRPSPQGLTIHPIYGLWIAHRVVALTSAALGPDPDPLADHPCDSCVGRPCESACPAEAVSLARGFFIEPCARHRIVEDSSCAYRCLAREACPVGAEFRYGPEQMHHHYSAALESIRDWRRA